MKFFSYCHNPYRAPENRCAMCGRPALHAVERDGMVTYLCCRHAQAVSGLPCPGHTVAGSLAVRTVTPEEISRMWDRVNSAVIRPLHLVLKNAPRRPRPRWKAPTPESGRKS